MKRMFGGLGVGMAGLGAMLFAYGCGSAARGPEIVRWDAASRSVGPQDGASAGPVLVTCQPGRRALVRQTVVNGQPVSEVECVAGRPTHGDDDRLMVQYVPAVAPAVSEVRVVPVAQAVQAPERRVVTERRVVYTQERRPAARQSRSWKKSAVIIGSSAGVGAGVGAAVGGKKGALIGAAIGGGSATIWDQVTRDRNR
jgi:hypothetical protein